MEQDIAAMLQALGTFMIGIGAFGSLMVSLRNGRKAETIAKKLDVLVVQTNGLAEATAKTNRDLGKAIGKAEEKDRQKGGKDV